MYPRSEPTLARHQPQHGTTLGSRPDPGARHIAKIAQRCVRSATSRLGCRPSAPPTQGHAPARQRGQDGADAIEGSNPRPGGFGRGKASCWPSTMRSAPRRVRTERVRLSRAPGRFNSTPCRTPCRTNTSGQDRLRPIRASLAACWPVRAICPAGQATRSPAASATDRGPVRLPLASRFPAGSAPLGGTGASSRPWPVVAALDPQPCRVQRAVSATFFRGVLQTVEQIRHALGRCRAPNPPRALATYDRYECRRDHRAVDQGPLMRRCEGKKCAVGQFVASAFALSCPCCRPVGQGARLRRPLGDGNCTLRGRADRG